MKANGDFKTSFFEVMKSAFRESFEGAGQEPLIAEAMAARICQKMFMGWGPNDFKSLALFFAREFKALNPSGADTLSAMAPALSTGVSLAIQVAARDNDVGFFIELGRALEAPARSAQMKQQCALSSAEFWLLMGWNGYGDWPPLQGMTDAALSTLYNAIVGGQVREDSMKKTRQRLGLRRSHRPTITGITVKGSKIGFRYRDKS